MAAEGRELFLIISFSGETEYRGIPPGEVAQAALSAMADNEYEIFIGEAKDLAIRARTNPEQAFQNINRW
jgi:hypothetical protein